MNRKAWILGVVAGLALVGGACGGDDDDDGGYYGDTSDDGAAEPAADPAARSATGLTTGEAQGSGGNLSDTNSYSAGLLDRKIIFTASLGIEAENVQASFLEAGNVARRAGGFVESSNLSFREGRDGEQYAYAVITLRVPAGQYDGVVSSLRGLAGTTLTREESGSTEVTEEYTDLESRLRNLARSEQQYLELLKQAETIEEILIVNDRIDGVRSQIEQIQGRLQVLDDLTDLATITLSIDPVPAVVATVDEPSGPPSVGEAFADAWDVSIEIARYAAALGAVVSVAAAWLAIPAGIGVLAAMRSRKRGAHTPSAAAE
jgi:hypothetical protein